VPIADIPDPKEKRGEPDAKGDPNLAKKEKPDLRDEFFIGPRIA
jgi:hypothetical protein